MGCWRAPRTAMTFIESWAVRFGPAEYFFMTLLCLVCLGLATSKSMPRMVAAMSMGCLLALIGVDVYSGTIRFTAGYAGLEEGLDPALVLIAFVLLPRIVGLTAPREAATPACGWVAGLRGGLVRGMFAWRLTLLVGAALLFPLEWLLSIEPTSRIASAVLLFACGILFYRTGGPGVVLVCTFQLGWMLDENFRRMLLLSQGGIQEILQRPLVLGFLAAMALAFAAHHAALQAWAKKRRQALPSQAAVS